MRVEGNADAGGTPISDPIDDLQVDPAAPGRREHDHGRSPGTPGPFGQWRRFLEAGGARLICAGLLAIVIVGWVLYEIVIGEATLMRVVQAVPGLSGLLSGELDETGLGLDALVRRGVAIAVFLLSVSLVLLLSRPRLLHDFLHESDHALNLAVVRVVIFFLLASTSYVDVAVSMSTLPEVLMIPPVGLDGVLGAIGVSEGLVRPLAAAFVVACLCAMIGLYTRPMAVVAVLLGLYVLAIPQSFGKVGHYHHMLWFAAVVAASPCADVLSVDAVRRAWRRARHGEVLPPGKAPGYALPLRMIWLLMGLLYFFPGFWKFMRSGTEWVLSDNLQLIMYRRWLLADAIPFFRLDQYPVLYQAAAAAAILFELLFILFILHPTVRFPAALVGMAFHQGNWLFLRLPFPTLQAAYVSFVNWQRVLGWVGAHLFRSSAAVDYDPSCLACRRVTGVAAHLDVFGRVAWNAVDAPGSHPSVRTLLGLWPRLPFLVIVALALVLPAARRGLSDHHRSESQASNAEAHQELRRHPAVAQAAVVGGAIFAAALLAGLVRLDGGWPVASYPQFAALARDTRTEIGGEVVRTDGSVLADITDDLSDEFTTGRYGGIVTGILDARSEPLRQARLDALVTVLLEDGLEVRTGDQVLIYQELLSVVPERWPENPLEREILYTYQIP